VIRTGVIGLGECGCKQAQDYRRLMQDVPILTVNSSVGDFAALDGDIVPQGCRFQLDEGGTGCNPAYGRKLMENALGGILPRAAEILGSVDLIYLFAAAGGGTGNGGALLLGESLRTETGIPVVYIITLPSDNDSLESRMGALPLLQNLDAADVPCLLVSNKRGFRTGNASSLSTPAVYDRINRSVASLLAEWSIAAGTPGAPVLDEREAVKVITAPGFHAMTRARIYSSDTPTDITQAIAETLAKNFDEDCFSANLSNAMALGAHVYGNIMNTFSVYLGEKIKTESVREWFPAYVSYHDGTNGGGSTGKNGIVAEAIAVVSGGEIPKEVYEDLAQIRESSKEIRERRRSDLTSELAGSSHLAQIAARVYQTQRKGGELSVAHSLIHAPTLE
jgi:cell division GTPase FtsZ